MSALRIRLSSCALANNVLWVAWQRLSDLPEDTRFGAFLGGVCVNVARNRLRSRRRRRWLVFSDVGADAEPAAADPSDAREALRATYAVLATMDLDLRICFALRYIDGCELTEVARLTEVSLATIKRRLVKADAAFLKSAQMHGVLSSWVAAGTRWGGLG